MVNQSYLYKLLIFFTEIGDVSKQKDMSGFYRHLYKTTVDLQTDVKKDSETIDKEKEENIILQSPNTVSKESHKDIVKSDEVESHKKQKRQYRKRTKSGSSKEEGEKTSSSSSSSDSSTSSSGSEEDTSKQTLIDRKDQSREKSPERKKLSLSHGKENREHLPKSVNEDCVENNKIIVANTINVKTQENEGKRQPNEINKILSDPVVSVNIWLKRTIGDHFDEALRRYLERKSKRQGSY